MTFLEVLSQLILAERILDERLGVVESFRPQVTQWNGAELIHDRRMVAWFSHLDIVFREAPLLCIIQFHEVYFW